MPEMRTRGDLLADRIAFDLIKARTVVRGLWRGLSDEERYAVGESTVYELKKFGDPWQLSDPLPEVKHEGYFPKNVLPKPAGDDKK